MYRICWTSTGGLVVSTYPMFHKDLAVKAVEDLNEEWPNMRHWYEFVPIN